MNSEKALQVGILVVRVGLGLVMFYYGSQKMLGLFGGAGFGPTLTRFQEGMGIPPLFGTLAIFAEFFGGLGLMLGFLTRVAAFGVASTMAVATFVSFGRAGGVEALMSGQPQQANQILFPLSLLLAAIGLVLTGAGQLSLDQKVFRKKK